MTESGSAPPTTPSPRFSTLRRAASIPTPLIFAVSVIVAVVILWREGTFADVGDAARRANGWTVAGALLLYLAGLALLCVRWHLLVRMIAGASKLPDASEAFLTSVVINYAAPIGLAVPTRAALTKRALGLSATQTGAVALWEIAVDVLVLGAGAALWLALGGRRMEAIESPSTSVLLGGGAVVVGGLLTIGLAIAVVRRRPQLWWRVTHAIRMLPRYPRQRPKDFLLGTATTVVYWVVQGIVLWLLLDALGVDASARLTLGLVSLPVLVGMLSPAPGGAGIREALMLAVARVHDADTAAVLLAALTYRVALFAAIPILYVGVRFWLAGLRRSATDETRRQDGETARRQTTLLDRGTMADATPSQGGGKVE